MNKKVQSFCIFVLLLSMSSGWCATEKYGIINRNERWTLQGSPYLITDDLLITGDGRVFVTPGVQILVGKPIAFRTEVPQKDRLDTFTIAITVQGALKCVGRRDNRILFSALNPQLDQCQWYGIVLNTRRSDEIELAFCDINNACNALTIEQGSPLIRNCIIEYNNIGILCQGESQPKIYNCILAHNSTAGINVQKANPSILNSIITYNKGNGVWSDNISQLTIEYSCFFANTDGAFYGCNPELGLLTRKNKNKDSTDFQNNLFQDPVFAGSDADSIAVEHDVSLPTDKSHIKDTTLAKIMYDSLPDSTATKWIARNYKRYSLSKYSPCVNAGKPGKQFNDQDGTRNDIGVFGGQQFIDFSKKQ